MNKKYSFAYLFILLLVKARNPCLTIRIDQIEHIQYIGGENKIRFGNG
jgi:hypothetical protein